jgi:hypothetical protein
MAGEVTEKALAASPNPEWTEYEMQSVDEWIARQDVKLDRSEAIRRLVELGNGRSAQAVTAGKATGRLFPARTAHGPLRGHQCALRSVA